MIQRIGCSLLIQYLFLQFSISNLITYHFVKIKCLYIYTQNILHAYNPWKTKNCKIFMRTRVTIYVYAKITSNFYDTCGQTGNKLLTLMYKS